ncbi:MAG: hypothetical protein Q8L92_16930, partial [Rubrivivax sp.]|nr:hypothetical protein [Rubrivivax sp.]
MKFDLDAQERQAIAVVRKLKWAAVALGLIVAIAPMTMRGYFAYEQALDVLQVEAQRQAAVLALRSDAGMGANTPGDWLPEQLDWALQSGEADGARVVNTDGAEVGRSGAWTSGLTITAAAAITLPQLAGAELELQRSLTPVLVHLAVVGAGSIAVGVTIYLLLARFAAGTLLTTLAALG